MGVATLFVLVGSSLLVSSFKRRIPEAVRLSTYILIIATWVTIADMLMEATVPDIQKALGAFVYLIVVNCIILGRQEAFAPSRRTSRCFSRGRRGRIGEGGALTRRDQASRREDPHLPERPRRRAEAGDGPVR
jgi:Na+-translocating ferredoxin:NAD+ oxidoreductase RnfE subunit